MKGQHWRIIGHDYELWLVPWGAGDAAGATQLSAGDARRALQDALATTPRWALASRAAEECAAELRARFGRSGAPLGDGTTTALYAAIERGLLTVWRSALRMVAATHDAIDAEALLRIPLASSLLPKTWIEIQLLDEDGEPVAGEPYWIQLTDGSIRQGTLDRFGLAYFGDLEPGECEVRWPALDGAALVGTSGKAAPARRDAHGSAADPSELGRKTWVEFELVDEDRSPVVDAPYRVTLSDGSIREGTSDARGLVRFEDINPGRCEFRWLDIDEPAVLEVTSA